MHGLIHARPIYQREPDALSDPRRCRPFIKAGSLQTGEVTEVASTASALEARAGLTKINKYRAHYKCADCVHHSRRTTNRRMCRITPVPKRHIIKEAAAYTLCSSLDISFFSVPALLSDRLAKDVQKAFLPVIVLLGSTEVRGLQEADSHACCACL